MKYLGQTVQWRELQKGDKGFVAKQKAPTAEELAAKDFIVVSLPNGEEKQVLRSELASE